MTRPQLIRQIREKETYLCVGLDPDLSKIPRHLLSTEDPIFQFNRQIIDATQDLCVAYKLNTAFYESLGVAGWTSLHKTIQYIPKDQFIIADAKRGDIGNTSSQYAKAFFDTLGCDAITVAPYMGEDSVKPFLEFPEKWAIVLGLTSNPGAKDFEMLQAGDEKLFEKVLRKVQEWGTPDNLMFVIGATQPEEFVKIRQIIPDHFFLVPGVGFQGGSLEEISKKAMNKDCGLLVNVSRAIIFAGGALDFAKEARAIAMQYSTEMKRFLSLKFTV